VSGFWDQRGQAAVETVAILPLVAVVAAIAWQVVVAGQAIWMAGGAARAAARAEAIGADREAAARRALPPRLEQGLRTLAEDDGVVVRVRIPAVLSGIRLGTATARAHLRDQGG